jgi:hypothetical protein
MPQKPGGGVEVQLYSFINLGTRRRWVVNATPQPVSIVEEAGWTPGLVRTCAENLAPPGLDPRTVQTVASRYTDCAIPVLPRIYPVLISIL